MEDVLPPLTEEGAGFESTRVRQFTVFLENKVGRLQSLVRSLEQGVGQIVALSIEESGDAALVRMICAHPEYGRELLRTAGFSFGECELLAVELPRTTKQPLLRICSALLFAEINIHYAYPLMIGLEGRAALALHVEDIETSVQNLEQKGFKLLSENDLSDGGAAS